MLRKKEDAIVKVFAMAVTVPIVSGIITTIVAVNQKQAGIRFTGPAFLHRVGCIILSLYLESHKLELQNISKTQIHGKSLVI